jgi:uncharacterized protein (DUF983 family)
MSQRQSSGGIGFVGLLAIVFIVLKLTGVIDWSWVWVLAPIWISTLCWIPLLIIAVIVALRKD